MKLLSVLTCYLLIFCQQIVAQIGGMGYYPYAYGGFSGMFGRPGGYPMYGYYPQYPTFGSYPCYTSIYCGRSYGNVYSGYPYYQNGFSTAFSSSSSGFSSYGSGGFFG